MKHFWVVLFVIVGCSKEPPNEDKLLNLKNKIIQEGKDRWSLKELYFNEKTGVMHIGITETDENKYWGTLKRRSYCQSIQDALEHYLPDYPIIGRFYRCSLDECERITKKFTENTNCNPYQ